ncbi:MAG: hypothetical protein NT091_03380 [Candidatus Falkowbacteria bacterium]|nr:hypothetical protein [Candidatus Falkowbacteria bacterium]
MNKQKTNKLLRYLTDFKELKEINTLVGAIIIDEMDRTDVVDNIDIKKNFKVLEVDEDDPNDILCNLVKCIISSEDVVLDIIEKIPSQLLEQLENLKNNLINVQLEDEELPTVIYPVPESFKIILLISNDYFENNELDNLIISSCKIG